MPIIDEGDFKKVVFDETEDLLDVLDVRLRDLEKLPDSKDKLKKVFKIIHTIKSNSAMMGEIKLERLAHRFEDLLGALRDGKINNTPQIMNLIKDIFVTVSNIFSMIKNKKEVRVDINKYLTEIDEIMKKHDVSGPENVLKLIDDPEMKKAFLSELNELIDSLENEIIEYQKDLDIKKHFPEIIKCLHTIKGNSMTANCYMMGNLAHAFEDLILMIKEGKLAIKEELFAVFFDAHSVLMEIFKKIRNQEKITIDVDVHVNKIKRIIEKGEVELDNAGFSATVFESVKSDIAEVETVRVDLKRIDKLITMLGELHLTNRMSLNAIHTLQEGVSKIKERMRFEPFFNSIHEGTNKFNYLFDEFRADLLKVRMIKFSFLFNRFSRMVRSLAGSLNKKIDLKMEGGDTEIDKRIIEQAVEPLLHIIRNSIDHGIEHPEDRRKKGKPTTGTINIKVTPEGGNIIIIITDDGAGIDSEKIREKIIRNGMRTEQEAKMMTHDDLIKTIFLHGFSTRDAATNISGRGVGMDIVASKLRQLKGELETFSEKDKGVKFRISLPMTLSIIDGFFISMGNKEFVFIKDDIKFLLKISHSDLQLIGGKKIINYEGQRIPIYDLGAMLKLEAGRGKAASSELLRIVILQYKSRLYGFKVDEFRGLKSMVLKNTGTFLAKLKLFEGVTIDESGDVILVLSKNGLIEDIAA